LATYKFRLDTLGYWPFA